MAALRKRGLFTATALVSRGFSNFVSRATPICGVSRSVSTLLFQKHPLLHRSLMLKVNLPRAQLNGGPGSLADVTGAIKNVQELCYIRVHMIWDKTRQCQ